LIIHRAPPVARSTGVAANTRGVVGFRDAVFALEDQQLLKLGLTTR
jgi:hypothetical protein